LRAGRQSVPSEWYAVTTCSVWPDLRPAGDKIIAEARRLEDEDLVELYAVVAMPDHVHLLFALLGEVTLGRVMKLFKGRSSRAANKVLGGSGSLWQRAYYDHLIRGRDESYAHWWYILQNPVRRNLVEEWEDYPHTYTVPYPN
jgi:putative transposase